MAQEKFNHPAFAGVAPEKIDHLNPPTPLPPAKSEPVKPDHFARIKPEPVSAPVKPGSPLVAANQPKP
jgi:hypothetical protein